MSRFNDSSDFEDLYTPSPKRFGENIENISLPSGYDDSMNFSSFLPSPAHLSALLEASKIAETSDVDNTLNCTDYLSKEIDEALKAKKLLDENLVDEINEYKCLLKEVASARNRCRTSEYVVQTMREEFENSTTLPSDLKKKCSERIRFSNFLRDFKNSDLLAAIGISSTLPPVSLTCDEKNVVNSAVRKALEKRISVDECEENAKQDTTKMLKDFSRNATIPGSMLTEENAKAISLLSEINEAINSCSEKTSSILSTFDQLWDRRLEKFQKLRKQEIIHLMEKIKLVELEFKKLNLQIENSMAEESDDIEKALDVLLQKLKAILEENEFSLQKTEAMKEAYKQLKGTRFDDILKEYSEVLEALRNKRWALKQLQTLPQIPE